LPSVFEKTLGKGLLFAEYFWELHSANLFFKEKIIIFFSAYHCCLPSVFRNYTRQTYFSKKKNNEELHSPAAICVLPAVAQELALFGHIVPSQWETARGMKLSLATKFQAIQK